MPKVKVIIIQWPWPKVTRIECLWTFSNDFSSETTGSISFKSHKQHLGNRGSKICSDGPDHMTKMAPMIIYCKNFKITFFSRTTQLIGLKFDMYQVTEYYQICSDGDSRLTLTHFSLRSNLIPWDLEWENVKHCIFQNNGTCSLW